MYLVSELLERLNPRIVECNAQLVAYADLQQTDLMSHFFVHEDWQGNGLGKALLRHVEDLKPCLTDKTAPFPAQF